MQRSLNGIYDRVKQEMIGIENFSILTWCHLSQQHQFGISLKNNLKKLFSKKSFFNCRGFKRTTEWQKY
jgi:hypothetical protein